MFSKAGQTLKHILLYLWTHRLISLVIKHNEAKQKKKITPAHGAMFYQTLLLRAKSYVVTVYCHVFLYVSGK